MTFLQWGFDLPNVTGRAGDRRQALRGSRFPQEMPRAGVRTGGAWQARALGRYPSRAPSGE